VDVTVSRFHAYFIEGPVGVELVDAGSRNGTRVDGQLLSPRQGVRGGERLQFGHVELRFVDGAGCSDFLHRTAR
jgi:pSer/pThr/pTyr-binding forkhead associated (FHA) protein